MKKREWEQDIINRQRNVVFPDTVLNEGRFYRNLVNSTRLSPGQRIGCALLSLMVIGSSWFFVANTLQGMHDAQGFTKVVNGVVFAISVSGCILGCIALCYCLITRSAPKSHHNPKDLQHPDKF